eukprot:scaffold48550_cov68-Phaeocystis_antarctica.AAC.6
MRQRKQEHRECRQLRAVLAEKRVITVYRSARRVAWPADARERRVQASAELEADSRVVEARSAVRVELVGAAVLVSNHDLGAWVSPVTVEDRKVGGRENEHGDALLLEGPQDIFVHHPTLPIVCFLPVRSVAIPEPGAWKNHDTPFSPPSHSVRTCITSSTSHASAASRSMKGR